MKLPLVAAVLSVSTAAGADQPLTFWRYAGGDQMQLQRVLDCALGRWRAATCLPIDVSYYRAHSVRWRPAEDMDGLMGRTNGASWNETRVSILEGQTDQQACNVLVHEMSHIMRRSNDHVSGAPNSTITTAQLEAVCGRQPCACFVPEAP